MLAVGGTAAAGGSASMAPSRIGARPQLRWNPLLAKAARAHSESMATEGYFDHVDSRGRTVGARARAAGFRHRVVGVNRAAGHPAIEAAIRGRILSVCHTA